MPLFRGFGKEANLDSVYLSEYSVRTAKRSLYSTRVNVILDTVSAVYDIIRQRELVRLFESLTKQLEGHSKIAKIRIPKLQKSGKKSGLQRLWMCIALKYGLKMLRIA